MIIWILDSESGIKLLYRSFLKTDADEDIVSGFLTAFNHFSMIEFKESLDSIEMGGLRWVYILEQDYQLLFVAADTKHIKTEILKARLNVIKNAFIKKFKPIWKKNGHWDGNINRFQPFLKEIEDYYNHWGEVENLAQMADFFDILGIFQKVLIQIRNIIEKKMYSKSKKMVLNKIEYMYNEFKAGEEFKKNPELENISFTKDSWFNIIDIDLIKCDMELVISSLKSILSQIINILKEVKGNNLCFKYFSEVNIYAYIFNNMRLLKDLNLDTFFFEHFLLL
ncbi:hypothetical protein LCGC14_1975630 [marine sediment metagenome]|uniref:FUZ/MON1/HPS1 first Longin domain-containing protein n=1 Tax=marine sediment metagenome TaxID=412755 RepID=A0A0F9FAH1_9ZZZZ